MRAREESVAVARRSEMEIVREKRARRKKIQAGEKVLFFSVFCGSDVRKTSSLKRRVRTSADIKMLRSSRSARGGAHT